MVNNMDLAERIKIFIKFLAIGSSQFADKCNIPRPTLSQILNGRNKKISDDIIGRIHQNYPMLSILWLMFGEGDMLISGNTRLSEPQEGETIDFGSTNNTNNQLIDAEKSDNKPIQNLSADKFDNYMFSNLPSNTDNIEIPPVESKTQSQFPVSDFINSNIQNTTSAPIQSSDPTNRRIVNIMVFYSDNSFETYIPANSQSAPD